MELGHSPSLSVQVFAAWAEQKEKRQQERFRHALHRQCVLFSSFLQNGEKTRLVVNNVGAKNDLPPSLSGFSMSVSLCDKPTCCWLLQVVRTRGAADRSSVIRHTPRIEAPCISGPRRTTTAVQHRPAQQPSRHPGAHHRHSPLVESGEERREERSAERTEATQWRRPA